MAEAEAAEPLTVIGFRTAGCSGTRTLGLLNSDTLHCQCTCAFKFITQNNALRCSQRALLSPSGSSPSPCALPVAVLLVGGCRQRHQGPRHSLGPCARASLAASECSACAPLIPSCVHSPGRRRTSVTHRSASASLVGLRCQYRCRCAAGGDSDPPAPVSATVPVRGGPQAPGRARRGEPGACVRLRVRAAVL